jgi:hypothetical protein
MTTLKDNIIFMYVGIVCESNCVKWNEFCATKTILSTRCYLLFFKWH